MSHKSSSSANSLNQIPAWNPASPPLYDINKTYLENAEEGPFFEGVVPERVWAPEEKWIDFLGFPVASPIGVPAGPLLNSKWTGLASTLGYDILCYKTIRNFDYAGHSLPNIVFVESDKQLVPPNLPPQILQQDHIPSSIDKIGITNSFGMPSRSPTYLLADIPKANDQMKKGQLLIVSIVGTPPQKNQPKEFIENFIATALLAKEGGAKVIEANFSCPNVATGEGCIYYNPKAVFEISSLLIKALQDLPLIIKVGIFPDKQMMIQTFSAAAKAGVRAISGVNTISMKVVNRQGKPALGPDRLTGGICGSPIRLAALEFTRQAREINDKEKLGLAIIGTGGATSPEHFTDFLNAGADVAMTATGMMWDPYLALRYHKTLL
jgi:dihydroorotate dehydrogenase (NAD+) catalytic subunit